MVNKVKNLVMEKIEKLKNLAEKYTKMKNLFEKEVETSPAFRLGESDANRIIKEWINMKQSQSDLRMKPDEKLKKFVRFILGENAEIIDVNKITPLPTSPQESKAQIRNNKSVCCEIF